MKSKIVIILLLLSMTFLFAGKSYVSVYPSRFQDSPKATGGVINSSANIVIQTGAYVVIAGAGNYTSEGTGSLPAAGTLDLTGNFINNNTSGEPVSATGTIVFSGTAEQGISGNPLTLGNVSFDNPAGINIGCDTSIGGNLTVSGTSGIINMTDYDFGVTGNVTGIPDIVVTGSGAVGEVGENANVTVDSPQPTGLPAVMNTLEVNPGSAQVYQLPNSTSVANLTFSSGSLNFDSYSVLLRNHDLMLGGANALSALTATLSAVPGLFGEHSSINKTWNITGQSSGDLTITLRWLNSENNGNDFSSGFANVFAHNGTSWQSVGRYPISIDGGYNLVSFTRSLGTKDGNNDYTVTGDGQTLPVELSSFTAIPAVAMNIILNWTTQSETGMSGYYVYRNIKNELVSAQNLNHLISATNTSTEQTYAFTDNEIPEAGTYYYWLQSVELNGLVHFYGPISATLSEELPDTPVFPTETKLIKVFPNPFNPNTNVSFSLKSAELVAISVYNCKGQLIWKDAKKYNAAGIYSVNWDGRNNNNRSIATGIYKLVFQAGGCYAHRSIVLMK